MQKINYCKKEKNCTSRELNPGWGDGNAPCYHYTTGAVTGLVGSNCSLHLCQLVMNKCKNLVYIQIMSNSYTLTLV